jgi:ATP-dependent Clp protease protease subunit
VDKAMDLLKQVNRNIAMTELEYPKLKGLLNVKFIINSGGGEIVQGLRLFDAIKNNIYEVNTVASGMAASMGIILLVGGHHVQAVENSVLMIHQMSGGMGGKYFELRDNMKYFTELQNKLSSILVENSKAKDKAIMEFMKGESFIMAADALKLGIIDEIIQTI